MSLGGTLSANAHGNTVGKGPIISDVESFRLVDARAVTRRCSREEHRDLFGLAIGGYGLFGVITSVRLRLAPARKLRFFAASVSADRMLDAFGQRPAEGIAQFEFQFVTDAKSSDFLRRGIVLSSVPAADDAPLSTPGPGLTPEEWLELVRAAHEHPSTAFDLYSKRLLESSGRVFWSDEQPKDTVYVPGYHAWLDRALGTGTASEVLTELFMPRERLPVFLEQARGHFLEAGSKVIFGTVRVCDRDDESFLAWAQESCGCVVFNLHTTHTPEEIAATADTVRNLVDMALSLGGRYYLTYNRFATTEQVGRCYPRLRDFLQMKLAHDPEEHFQSDWYRHYREAFGISGPSSIHRDWPEH